MSGPHSAGRIRWLAATFSVALLLFAPGIVVLSRVAVPSRISNTTRTTFDAIVVLGCAANDDGTPTGMLDDRVRAAVRRFEQGRAPRIVVTGGAVHGRWVEAEVMAALARSLGVPDAAIELEPAARNTIENARFSARLLRARGERAALVVTSGAHVRRAGWIFGEVTELAYAVEAAEPRAARRAGLDALVTILESGQLLRLVWLGDARLMSNTAIGAAPASQR